MKILKKCIAILLVAALFAGFLPTDLIAEAYAAMPDRAAVKTDEFAALPGQGAELAEQGKTKTLNGWQYVRIPDTNYAVIVGYTGEAAAKLEIPDRLGRLDVAAVAPEALRALRGVETVIIPGNVRAIGTDALPRGAAVCALNASYASYWADKNGHAFVNASEYQFLEGVIDLSDIRTDRFVRVSANEVRLAALEASRLEMGKTFFLVDPANPYQISYYKVVGISEGQNGFTVFSCETPDVDHVLAYYEAHNEVLVPDLSATELYEGVQLADGEVGASAGIGGDATKKTGLTIHFPEIQVGRFKISIGGGYESSYSADVEVGLFKQDSETTITEKQSFTGSVKISGSTSSAADTIGEQSGLSKEFLSEMKGLRDRWSEHLLYGRDSLGPDDDLLQVETPLANMVLFSFAGIVNVTLQVNFALEFSGELSVTCTFSNTTTYSYVEGQNPSQIAKEGVKKITGEIKGEFKVGVTLEIGLYICAVKVFKVSVFAGFKATAAFDLEYKYGKNGAPDTNEFDLALQADEEMMRHAAGKSNSMELPSEVNVNMLDVLDIKADFVIEMSIWIGAGKTVDVYSKKGTVVDFNVAELHWHLFPYVYDIEAYTDDWEDKSAYTYYYAGEKDDRFHRADRCPYDLKTVTVNLPYETEAKQLYQRRSVELQTEFAEPDASIISGGQKMLGWYTDAGFSSDQRVREWPVKIVRDTDFYACTVPYHKLHLIDAMGKEIVYDQMAMSDELPIGSGEHTVDWEGRLAEDEYIRLPASKPNGDQIEYWVRVVSARNRLPAEGNTADPTSCQLTPGEFFFMSELFDQDVYLCAITDKDVVASFYTGVGSNCITVYAKRGDAIALPACTDTLPRYAFSHWTDETGSEVAGPIQTTEDTPATLTFFADWEPDGTVTALPLGNTYIGTGSTAYTDVLPSDPESAFTYAELDDGTLMITKLIDTGLTHLRIPGSIDGKTVTVIGSGAFRDTALVSVTLPNSVTELRDNSFRNCTNLRLIDMSAVRATAIPDSFAYGCTKLRRVLLPAGLQSIGSSAFYGCTAIDGVGLSCDIGAEAFWNCEALADVELGGGVTAIGEAAFDGCTALTSLTVPDSVRTLGVNFVRNCVNLTELTVDASIDKLEADTLYIGDGAKLETLVLGGTISTLTYRCLANGDHGFTQLTDVTLPPQAKNLGSELLKGSGVTHLTVSFLTSGAYNSSGAFQGMDSLTELTVAGGVIPDYAFANNRNLQTVHLGDRVVKIGTSAFSGCTGLTVMDIPADTPLMWVGANAFSGCTGLTSLSLPERTVSIGDNFISGCTGLKTLSIEGYFDGSPGSGLTLTSQMLYIGPDAVLETVRLGRGVIALGNYALANYNGKNTYYYPTLKTLELGENLGRIGSYACQRTGITEITVDSGVQVDGSAFAGCSSLTRAVLSDASGASSLFNACPNLTTVEVRAGEIGESAFSGCTALTSITLDEGVTAIGASAFYGCTGLTRLEIPDSVTSCGARMLEGCTNLRYLRISGSVDLSSSVGDREINYNPFYIGDGAQLETLVLGEGITAISAYRFANYDPRFNNGFGYYYYFPKLTTVVFPSTLTAIGYQAFSGAQLTELDFPGEMALSSFSGMTTLKRVRIGAGEIPGSCFSGCTGLTEVELGAGVTRIGDDAFSGCWALKTIRLGEGLSEIGASAFSGCSGLTRLEIPDSVTSCGARMLEGCTNLRYLRISGSVDLSGSVGDRYTNNNPFYIGEGAQLETLVLGEGITAISDYRFANYDPTGNRGYYYYFPKLTTVVLPSTLTAIGYQAFRGAQLTELDFPGEMALSNNAFSDMTTLKRVRIGAGEIPGSCFENCTGLTEVELGAGVTKIGSNAFSGCTALKTIRLGEGLSEIGASAFSGCTGLTRLEIPDSVTSCGARMLEGCTNLRYLRISGSVDLSGSVGDYNHIYNPFYIGDGAQLETLVLGEGITAISDYRFANYDPTGNNGRGYYYYFPKLTTVVLPSTLTAIGYRAFRGAQLTELDFPGEMALSDSAFSGMTTLKRVRIGAGEIPYSCFSGCGGLTEVELGAGVTKIGSNAFSGCTALKTIRLGEGLSEIGASAFSGCTGLTRLEIPDSVTSCGARMLEGCTNLRYLRISGSVDLSGSVGDRNTNNNPFYIGDGSQLETLVLGEGITAISAYRFANYDPRFNNGSGHYYYFPKLTTVVFPSTLTAIGYQAFSGAQLTELDFPGEMALSSFSGMTTLKRVRIGAGEIPGSCFSGCTGLTEVELGAGVTKIGDDAFSGCWALKTIRLGEGLSEIGASAFSGCTGLTRLEIPDSVTSCGARMLEGCTNLRYLRISGSVDLSGSVGDRYTNNNPFYIGDGAHLETLVLGEGITAISDYRFANYNPTGNNGRGYYYYFPKLRAVRFPASLTEISSSALSGSPTLYSDTENPVLTAFAQSKGLSYVFSAPRPTHRLLCVVPAPEDSVSASGVTGVPEGFALASEAEYAFGDNLQPAAPQVPAGCVFRGWYLDEAYTMPLDLTQMPAEDLILYARIDAPVSLRFAVDQPSLGTADETLPEGWRVYESFRVLPGESLPYPAAEPAAEGYTFRGWYADAECLTVWVTGTVPAEGATLYALMEEIPTSRIRFAVDLPQLGEEDDSLPEGWRLYAGYDLPYGSAFPYPSAPVAEGWVFEGWYDSPALTESYDRHMVGSSDVTYYAKFSRLAPGGRYRNVDGGLELLRYQVEEDEGDELFLPSYVNGLPVVSIGARAFASGGVAVLHLPDTLSSFDPAAFEDSEIQGLYISRTAAHYSTAGGALYDKDFTELLVYPAARRSMSLIMPDTVTKIAAGAVQDNPYLRNVRFSEALAEIGEEAFSGCTALETVALPDTTAILRKNAFADCRSLNSFTAYGLTLIEDSVESDESKANTIPRGVEAVYGPLCSGVLRDWFCYTLSNGERITYQYNQYPLTLILDGETEQLGSEAGMPLPREIRDLRFDDGTFVQSWYRDEALTQPWDMDTDVMPAEALTLYATKTPQFTAETVTVEVDGVNRTGLCLLGYNGRAEDLTVPNSIDGSTVIAIGDSFLSESSGVQSLKISSRIVSIGDNAMAAFTGTIVCDAGSAAAVWADAHGVETSLLKYTLSFVSEGRSVKSLEAARGTAIVLPELANGYRSLTGWYTDSQTTHSVTLDEDGLYIMPGIDMVLYAGWDRAAENVPFTWIADETRVTVTGYTGTSTAVTIPATINGLPVTAVGDGAFAGTPIRSVDLGSVTVIGEDAFADCADLRRVEPGANLTEIGSGAFARCVSLGSFTLPDSVTSLGSGAFADCTGLRTLTLGAQLQTFPLDAVAGCPQLRAVNAPAQSLSFTSADGVLYNADTTVLRLYPQGRSETSFAIPDGVTVIGEGAFENAQALRQVTVPASVTDIGAGAFAGTGLTAFSAAGLLTIGEDTFLGCSALVSVEPGDSLTGIGNGAFCGCSALRDIHIPASADLSENTVLFSADGVLITGVLGSSAHAYAQANGLLFNDPNATPVTAVTLSQTEAVLQRGEKMQLTATYAPANADSGTEIRWYSSNDAVAYVDETGLVSAMGGGNATITAVSGNGIEAVCTVEVQVAVTDITLTAEKQEVRVGESVQAEAILLPGSATERALTWASGDPAVAAVDADGLITGVAPGETTVTATTQSELNDSLTIEVYAPAAEIRVNAETQTLYLIPGRDSLQLAAEVLPAEAKYRDVVWTSSDTSVATVDEAGLVTAHGLGTVTITAASDGPDEVTGGIELIVGMLDLSELELASAALSYTGQDQREEAIRTVLAGTGLTDGVNCTVKCGEILHAGTYTLTVSGTEPTATGTATASCVIAKADVTVTCADDAFFWEDTLTDCLHLALTPATDYTLAFLPEGEDTTVEWPQATGCYAIRVIVADTDDVNGTTVTLDAPVYCLKEDSPLNAQTITLLPGQSVCLPGLPGLERNGSALYTFATSDSGLTLSGEGVVSVEAAGSYTVTITAGGRTLAQCEIMVAELASLSLPVALRSVEEEAFMDDASIQRVVLGGQVTSIGRKAFANAPALRQIVIPGTVNSIGELCFDGSQPVIVCAENSEAQRAAIREGLPYVFLTDNG